LGFLYNGDEERSPQEPSVVKCLQRTNNHRQNSRCGSRLHTSEPPTNSPKRHKLAPYNHHKGFWSCRSDIQTSTMHTHAKSRDLPPKWPKLTPHKHEDTFQSCHAAFHTGFDATHSVARRRWHPSSNVCISMFHCTTIICSINW
jgi:hypothetical protein